MHETARREGKLLVAVAIVLALVSITLAPTIITDKDYLKPFPIVFMFVCCVHLAVGSDHARGFIAAYLTLFGSIRVFAFVFVAATGGPVARNSVSLIGATLGLVAAGILSFSKPLRTFLQFRSETRSRHQTIFVRTLWSAFLVYCAVIVYFDLTSAT